jgi:ABC-type transport system involved in multi-copper enzyme maturation permease subunit
MVQMNEGIMHAPGTRTRWNMRFRQASTSIFSVAKLTFYEALRKKIVWAALLLGLIFLIVFGAGFYFAKLDFETRAAEQEILNQFALYEMYNFLLQAGLYAVNFLTIAITVLASVGTLSGEIESGTIQTIATKPIRRWQIVIGKWLGFVVMATVYLIYMAGGTVLLAELTTGYTVPNLIYGLGLLWLNAILFLSVTLWGGSFLSTLANGIMAFGLYSIAFIGGWIETFGAFFKNPVVVNIGIISSLIMPCEALWRRASFLMESPIVAFVGVSPFTATYVPSSWMVLYAFFFASVFLLLGIRQFVRRDL